MAIVEELNAELADAMRNGDKARRDVVRQIKSELAVAQTAPGFTGDLDNALCIRVIGSYVKKMSKTIGEYRDAGERGAPMVAKLEYEIAYLSRWLPQRLDEDATRRLVEASVAELGVAGDPKAAGRVMGAIMKAHQDQVDGGLLKRLVAEVLGSPL